MSLFFEVLFQMFSGVKVMLLVLSILDGFHGLQLLDLSNSTRISDDNSFKFPPVGICLSLRNHWVMGLLHSKAVLFSSNWSKILYGTLSNFVHLYFVKVFCLFFLQELFSSDMIVRSPLVQKKFSAWFWITPEILQRNLQVSYRDEFWMMVFFSF